MIILGLLIILFYMTGENGCNRYCSKANECVVSVRCTAKSNEECECFEQKKVVKGGDKMYEVTYSIDGVIKKISVVANDAITAQNLATNMFGTGKVQIIEIRRK